MSESISDEQPWTVVRGNEVKFLVGPDRIVYVVDREKLAAFLTSMDQLKEDDYEVDIAETSFQVFLDLVEGKLVGITSVAVALDLLEVAELLVCIRLNNLCVEYLKAHYECDRAIAIYSYAKNNNLDELAKDCLSYINAYFKHFAENQDFYKLDVRTLAGIYSSDKLNATEVDLLKALVSYTKHHELIHSQVRVLVDKIRFHNADIKELLQVEGMDCLLTDKELLRILVENCECNKVTITRDGHQVVPIHYRHLSNVVMKGTKLQCSLSFSQNVFLESIRFKSFVDNDIESVLLNINNVETAANIAAYNVSIQREILTSDKLFLVLHMRTSCLYDIFVESAWTTASGVKINPGPISEDDYFVIERIIIKRLEDVNKVLEISHKTKEIIEKKT